MIKLIIFDYDGVIVDSFTNVHSVYKIICRKLGKSCPEKFDDFKKIYGHSSSECYLNLGFSKEEIAKASMIFKKEILKKSPKPFEGVIEVLIELHKDHTLALISSSYKEEVEQKLKKFGLLDVFDFILAKEGHEGRFEKTEPIKKIINDLSLKSDEALLVGDRNVDFAEGSKAGLKNILLVDYGWGYELEEIPEYKQKPLVREPRDILSAIKKF